MEVYVLYVCSKQFTQLLFEVMSTYATLMILHVTMDNTLLIIHEVVHDILYPRDIWRNTTELRKKDCSYTEVFLHKLSHLLPPREELEVQQGNWAIVTYSKTLICASFHGKNACFQGKS